MRVVSINTGRIQTYIWRKGTDSAILKTPRSQAVYLSETGFEGDETADTQNHGGLEKAVLMIPTKNYALFDVKQPFGFLGETLTYDGGDETHLAIGDRFQIGSSVIEISQPRMPCFKLGSIMNDTGFVQRYTASGRVGAYCRVIKTGEVKAGMMMTPLPSQYDHPKIQVKALFLAKLKPQSEQDWTLLKLAVQHPALSSAWRSPIQKLLERNEL